MRKRTDTKAAWLQIQRKNMPKAPETCWLCLCYISPCDAWVIHQVRRQCLIVTQLMRDDRWGLWNLLLYVCLLLPKAGFCVQADMLGNYNSNNAVQVHSAKLAHPHQSCPLPSHMLMLHCSSKVAKSPTCAQLNFRLPVLSMQRAVNCVCIFYACQWPTAACYRW